MEICALGITAPDVSFAVPVNVAPVTWAWATEETQRASINAEIETKRKLFEIILSVPKIMVASKN